MKCLKFFLINHFFLSIAYQRMSENNINQSNQLGESFDYGTMMLWGNNSELQSDSYFDYNDFMTFSFHLDSFQSINLQDDKNKSVLQNNDKSQTDILQNNSQKETNSAKKIRKFQKTKVDLSNNADLFKSLFYRVFTFKKKFPKYLVKKIHNMICTNLGFRPITREEFRSIDLYFLHYAKKGEIILNYIQQYKGELLKLIPELHNLK